MLWAIFYAKAALKTGDFTATLFSQSNEIAANQQNLYFSYLKGTNTEISNKTLKKYINDYYKSIYERKGIYILFRPEANNARSYAVILYDFSKF